MQSSVIAMTLVLLSLSFPVKCDIDPFLYVSDFKLTLCRNTKGVNRCGHFSLREWPLQYEASKELLENCVPNFDAYMYLEVINNHCDAWYGQFEDAEHFYGSYPACKYVWVAKSSFDKDAVEYLNNFNAHECKIPADVIKETSNDN